MKLLRGGLVGKFSPAPDDDQLLDSPSEQNTDYRKNLPGPMHTPPRLRTIRNGKGNKKIMVYDENFHGLIHHSHLESHRDSKRSFVKKLALVFIYLLLISSMTLGILAYFMDMKLLKCDTRIQDYLEEHRKKMVSELKDIDTEILALKSVVTKEMGQVRLSMHQIAEELSHMQLKTNDVGGANILEQLYGEQPDYALEKNGGSVHSILDTQTYAPHSVSVAIYGITLWKHIGSSPTTVIKGLIHPGECWAFRGEGKIALKMARSIVVTSVAIEHIPKSITTTGNIDSAPRYFAVLGFETVEDFPLKWQQLGNFEYLRDGPPRQQFYTELKKRDDGNPVSFQLVQFDFKTNHGNDIYTCIYRTRVYGREGQDVIQNNQELTF